MQTITITTHWFGGALPSWYRLFLRTCEWNPTIRWLVVTDQSLPWVLSENVRVVPMMLEALAAQATARTGYSFPARSGYRVGDWRPAFGEIFSDLLQGSDFWGHCDPDVFFGNVRAFLSDEMLCNYDVISSDTRMLCGAFTLYRNTPKVNGAYRGAPDFQAVLDERNAPGFDEEGMDRHLRRMGGVRVLRAPLCSYSELCREMLCDASGLYLNYTQPAMAHHFRAVKGDLINNCPETATSWVLRWNELGETGTGL